MSRSIIQRFGESDFVPDANGYALSEFTERLPDDALLLGVVVNTTALFMSGPNLQVEAIAIFDQDLQISPFGSIVGGVQLARVAVSPLGERTTAVAAGLVGQWADRPHVFIVPVFSGNPVGFPVGAGVVTIALVYDQPDESVDPLTVPPDAALPVMPVSSGGAASGAPSLRPLHLLTDMLVLQRTVATPDGQGGFTETVVGVGTVRGRVALTNGQVAHIDAATDRILSLTTATGWLDQDGLPGATAATLNGPDIQFMATTGGPQGNHVSITFVVPAGTHPLVISTVGKRVTVSLATTNGVSTSTAAEVVDALNTDPLAAQLVVASLRLRAYGSQVQTAMGTTRLSGGATFGLPRENDIILTPDGQVWSVVSSGMENRLVQVQLVAKS